MRSTLCSLASCANRRRLGRSAGHARSAWRSGHGPERLEDRRLMSATPADVANALVETSDYRAHVADLAYEQYLGRPADSAGSDYWVGQMAKGVTKEQVEAAFIGSPEYIANHGGTGEGWVKGMYEDLLTRLPDQAGLNYWDQKLAAGANPTLVAWGFAASSEREGLVIDSIYEDILSRQPSASEVNYWVNAFAHGTASDQIMARFVGSDEYFSRHGGDDREWFDAAYTAVFDTPPDANTEINWLDQMGYTGAMPDTSNGSMSDNPSTYSSYPQSGGDDTMSGYTGGDKSGESSSSGDSYDSSSSDSSGSSRSSNSSSNSTLYDQLLAAVLLAEFKSGPNQNMQWDNNILSMNDTEAWLGQLEQVYGAPQWLDPRGPQVGNLDSMNDTMNWLAGIAQGASPTNSQLDYYRSLGYDIPHIGSYL